MQLWVLDTDESDGEESQPFLQPSVSTNPNNPKFANRLTLMHKDSNQEFRVKPSHLVQVLQKKVDTDDYLLLALREYNAEHSDTLYVPFCKYNQVMI
ncbi:MAG: hypothetical protein OXC30_02015 [Alphaproteobacteria bacterium]|nr:hypothetical protein [Alphaproteobacteria bacterium]